MKILLTAFEPYEQWAENSSWLTLVELLKDRPACHELVTRRYPVDLASVRERLYRDLGQGFDAVLHTGQSPGSTAVKLESLAINFAGRVENGGEELSSILDNSPLAYRSQLPVGVWASRLREKAIPASVSYHAGTFLCNATMFLSLHYGQELPHGGRVGFIHLPLATQQVVNGSPAMPSLPVELLSTAIRIILDDLSSIEKESTQDYRQIANTIQSERKHV